VLHDKHPAIFQRATLPSQCVRYAMARAQLDAPGDRPPFKPMLAKHVQDGPTPGPPSADAPTDLHAVNNSDRRQWQRDPLAVEACLRYQRLESLLRNRR
jgi:hypothetical protein